MEMPVNAFKRAIRAGTPQIGLWNCLGSGTAVELLGDVGFDWLLLDTEHSPVELPAVLDQLRALVGSASHPIVRPAWNDIVLIKRLLDVGAQTLLVPFVQNAEEAARAVAAVRYPPLGVRGVSTTQRANRYGRIAGYHARAPAATCLLVQLETRAALAQLESVAAVDGVDGIFIGPADLSADFGHLGNPGHPEVQAAIADACARCRKAGTPAGILAPAEADAKRYLEMGFTFVAVGSDLGVLRRGAEDLLARFR